MDRKYRAFTLVEMLIVMGIMIILMAVGIAGARFALQRANKIQHQSAVDAMYQALQGYYSDNRKYPVTADLTTGYNAKGLFTLLTTEGYMDGGGWDGGSDATYYYFVDEASKQSFLVCASMSPNDDEANLGFYCNGNGFDNASLSELPTAITGKDIAADSEMAAAIKAASTGSEWTSKAFE